MQVVNMKYSETSICKNFNASHTYFTHGIKLYIKKEKECERYIDFIYNNCAYIYIYFP